MKGRLLAAAMIVAWVSAAMAAQPLTGEQLALAMWTDAAMFAADSCPKLQLIKENIRANLDSAGVTPDQATGGEWKKAMAFADMQNTEGFGKDPVGYCARMWKALGDNPVAVKLPLLRRSAS